MSGVYPHFRASYTHDELVEFFLLTPADLELVFGCRTDVNRCGMALLLKALDYLGHVPDGLKEVPPEVRTFIASQLGLLWDCSEPYVWESRTRDQHLSLIRRYMGWRPCDAFDKDDLEQWLRQKATYEVHTLDGLFAFACHRLRSFRVELPAEGELQRVVQSALSGFFQDIQRRVAAAIPAEVRGRIDQLLVVPEGCVMSEFERIKADPGTSGAGQFETEVEKLRTIRAVGLSPEPFASVPWKVLQTLRRRAMNEKASEMREHGDDIRYALMGCVLHMRNLEVTDDVTRMAIELIHRLDVRSEKQIHREWLADLERVDGKLQILSTVARAVLESPDGIVREVLFPRVKEETFQNLVAEFTLTGPNLRLLRQTVMQRKFARHYRRMLLLLLETITFRSDNRFRPVIDALAPIQRHVRSPHRYFQAEETIPLDGVVTTAWQEKVCETIDGERKIHRRYYELCVLQKLQRALKCKEIWVKGSYAFRNQSEDMPRDWENEPRRRLHYEALGKPVDAQTFVRTLKARLVNRLQPYSAAAEPRAYLPSQAAGGAWVLGTCQARAPA